MPTSPSQETTTIREFVLVGIWIALVPLALSITLSVARAFWEVGSDFLNLLLNLQADARLQAWATLLGSFIGAFLAGAFAIGAFALERRLHRKDADEKLVRLLQRALPNQITPPWILEYLVMPLAKNLAECRNFETLWPGQINEFPCALDLSELIEERISEDAPDILAVIHDVRKRREAVFNIIQFAKVQRQEGLELYQSRHSAMNELTSMWFNYILICRDLIKKGVISIDNFEESAKRASDKLLELNGKTAVFQVRQ